MFLKSIQTDVKKTAYTRIGSAATFRSIKKTSLRILLTGLAFISVASAPAETIFVTGSTAFRKTANAVFYALYAGNLMATDQSSTNSLSAANLLFTNCTVGNATVDISIFWSSSEAGIQTVASSSDNRTLPFLDKNLISSKYKHFPVLNASGGSYGTVVSNSPFTSLQKGCIAFSDTWQSASVFNGLAPDNITYDKLSLSPVGVVTFTFAASKDFPWRDLTDEIISQACTEGYVTGNLFSGNPSDTNIKAWLFGRNPDSGTRSTMLSVTKIGIDSILRQFTPTIVNGMITSLSLTEPGIINGIRVVAGDNGESSGEDLCNYLTNVFASDLHVPSGYSSGSKANYAITYCGCADALGSISNGLVPLSYNGVQGRLNTTNPAASSIDQGFTNIITGRYPFWSYEHVGYDPRVATPQTLALVQTLITTIKSLPSSSSFLSPNIALSDMIVRRHADGGPMHPVSDTAALNHAARNILAENDTQRSSCDNKRFAKNH